MRSLRYARMLLAALLITTAVSTAYSQTPALRDLSGLEEVYQSIDSQPKLTIADKYDQKMKVFTDTLSAGDAYTSAFEDLAAYTEIARETGAFFTPGFGAKLLEFQTRLEDATKNRVFDAYGKVSKASGYATQAVTLISEVDAILGDTNLTPAGRRSLAAIKSLGFAMQTFGEKVPGLGKGLEVLGQITSELTGVVRGTAKNIVDLRGGTFAPSDEERQGLDSVGGFGFIRTPLYNHGLPVVQELINENRDERTMLQTAPGTWREVNYDDVTAIWSEYRFANGREPTPSEVVAVLDSPLLRDRLDTKARSRVDLLRAQRLIDAFELPGLNPTRVQSNERELQEILQNLGVVVPKNSSAFNLLLKNRLVDPHLDDQTLKQMAISLHPDAGDYFKWRGIDPYGLSLEELGLRLITYRVTGWREFAAHRRSAAATAKTATLEAALDKGIARVLAERKAPPPTTAPKPDTTPPGLAACYKAEQDYYQSAVDWFPKIHDKNSFAHWSPNPMHSAQEVPPKACSDAYYATRNNPGMWDKAWDILQECGWKVEIQKRLEALEKKKAQCAQTR